MEAKQPTYFIVGAGVAGLSCARLLKKKKPKSKVIVFDACDNVGGRCYSFDDKDIDMLVLINPDNPSGNYLLKEGDFISVSVKNTNTTISQMIKNVLYSVTGDQSYVISAQASGAVVTTGY